MRRSLLSPFAFLVDIDAILKDVSSAIEDPSRLSSFIREKSTIAIERFLNYLPKMSIPVERRDFGDGWVITCRGQDGRDLTLADVIVSRDNIVCQVLGGDALTLAMSEDDASMQVTQASIAPLRATSPKGHIEESILDHIREMLLQAQRYGCWQAGIGGVGQPPSDRHVASVLRGLPVSAVLNTGIELWQNLEIDDDELLEIAVRDVAYQIELQKDREDKENLRESCVPSDRIPDTLPRARPKYDSTDPNQSETASFESFRRRFNPRVDPTVLYLEMKNLSLRLDDFWFRIEKGKRKTLFDPVFEGRGMLSIQGVSIKVRIACAKERMQREGLGADVSSPILQVRELEVELDTVKLRVRDTGFGSDWFVNKAVETFTPDLSQVVEDNLREQIREQVDLAMVNLNAYFMVNPDTLLQLLGIDISDLEENIVWV